MANVTLVMSVPTGSESTFQISFFTWSMAMGYMLPFTVMI